jgi:uncharacterized membrane protein
MPDDRAFPEQFPEHLPPDVAAAFRVLRGCAATLYIGTIYVGMIASPLRTTLVEAPVTAVLLIGGFIGVYRSFAEEWPSPRQLRAAGAAGWGLPLYFHGARALEPVGAVVTVLLLVSCALLVARWLACAEAEHADPQREHEPGPGTLD